MKLIFALFCFLAASVASAKDSEKKQIQTLSKIQASLQKNPELQMEFKQTVYGALRKRKKKSTGYAYFKKPAKFRWAIEKPYPQHLIYNGLNFAEINPKAKTGTVYPSTSSELGKYSEMVSIVMDIEKLTGRFKIHSIENHSDLAYVILKPKKREGIDSVELHVSHKMKIISSVKINYSGGNYWNVDFANPKFGSLPSDAFSIPTDKSYNIRTL